MKIETVFAVAAALNGCAAYNQVMINADGHEAYCDTAGAGLFGALFAEQRYESCIDSRRAAGYLEVEKAGAFGATFNDQGYILRLAPRGPAMLGGLKVNDQIITVNGVATNTGREITALLFAPAGTHITLRIKRDGSEKDISVTSASWSQINGFKPL